MGDKTKIEWTDATWNPVTGCTKVSQGCKNCYAERVFPRAYSQAWMPDGKGGMRIRDFTDVQTHPDRLDQPLRWKKPRRIFVNSMSDLFHEAVPPNFILKVFDTMLHAPQHTFQILTKRPVRMFDIIDNLGFNGQNYVFNEGQVYKPLPNVHLGVSCEDQPTFDDRSVILSQTPAAVRFLSLEPLLGAIDTGNALDDPPDGSPYGKIHWVIVGGESGPNARPIHPDWARSLRDQCQAAGVPFFFKQWGEWAPKMFYVESGKGKNYDFGVLDESGNWLTTPWNGKEGEQNGVNECTMLRVGKKAAGAMLDGREWKEFPE